MNLTEKDQARFWAKVALPNEQGCMLWLGNLNERGYGQFKLNNATRKAHQLSYALAYGPVPEGLEIDHVKARGCTNRHCVAPLHLEAVTRAENNRRADLGAPWRAKTHCPQGHAYDVANTRLTRDGRRQCRSCARIRAAKIRARKP